MAIGRALVFAVVLICIMIGYTDAASHTMDNILDFFPLAQDDGLNIIWAHGVNSHEKLDQSLSDDTMMLETDIILRGIGTPNQTDIPVNAHPPAVDSDLLTVDFINKTTMTPDKGMKLDFKYLEAVGPTMEIFLELEEQVNCPLWINADIVKGPNSPRDPVDPVSFIETANSYYNQTVMSLGFTTDWGVMKTEDMYTWTMIFDILQYTYPLDPQPVTYPIRAIWCVRSWSKFTWLLGLRESFTITVWTGSADPVDIQGLISLRTHGDIRRIFYDLPDLLRDNFLEGIEAGDPQPDPKPVSDWERNAWTGYNNGQGNFVFLSTESVGISGPADRAGYIQSVEEYQVVRGETMVTARGTLQFVDRYDAASNEAALEVLIRTSAIDGTNSAMFFDGATPPSIKLQIGRDGLVTLHESESEYELTHQLPAAECYSFELADRGDGGDVEALVTVSTCSDASVVDTNEGTNCTLTIPAEQLPEFNRQSFVVLAKKGGSGDIVIENLAISEAESDEPGGALHCVMSIFGVILSLLAALLLTL